MTPEELQIIKEARRVRDVSIASALKQFNMYGMGDIIPMSHKAIVEACEKYAETVKEVKNV